jgi:Holliday junction resolvasome RuvABC endonuclease subunit
MLQSVIVTFCEERKIEYRGYSPSEIKKFATGKGNANKEQMVHAAQGYGAIIEDDNHADALHLLHLAIRDLETA